MWVEVEDAASRTRAEALAASLGAAGATEAGAAPAGAIVLTVGPGGLGLRLGGGPSVTAAVASLGRAPRQAPDPLWRAALAGKERVVDATAGLGGDAFRLASRGAHVILIERSPLLSALLADALERAVGGALGPAAAEAAGRVELVTGDARDVLRAGALAPERRGVVYLDPMFTGPGGRALPPKGMALLRELLGADESGAPDLLQAAREAATRRVVVKRHLRAEPLGGVEPSGSLRGRTVRYDVYPPL